MGRLITLHVLTGIARETALVCTHIHTLYKVAGAFAYIISRLHFNHTATTQITEMTDAAGNVTEVKQKKKLSMREKKALIKKLKQLIADGGELESEVRDVLG